MSDRCCSEERVHVYLDKEIPRPVGEGLNREAVIEITAASRRATGCPQGSSKAKRCSQADGSATLVAEVCLQKKRFLGYLRTPSSHSRYKENKQMTEAKEQLFWITTVKAVCGDSRWTIFEDGEQNPCKLVRIPP